MTDSDSDSERCCGFERQLVLTSAVGMRSAAEAFSREVEVRETRRSKPTRRWLQASTEADGVAALRSAMLTVKGNRDDLASLEKFETSVQQSPQPMQLLDAIRRFPRAAETILRKAITPGDGREAMAKLTDFSASLLPTVPGFRTEGLEERVRRHLDRTTRPSVRTATAPDDFHARLVTTISAMAPALGVHC